MDAQRSVHLRDVLDTIEWHGAKFFQHQDYRHRCRLFEMIHEIGPQHCYEPSHHRRVDNFCKKCLEIVYPDTP